jgi:hypothetical protein
MLGSLQIVMDVETAEAVETLRADIHRVEHEVGRVDTSLSAKIERVETSLTARIDDVESALTARIDHVETSLTGRINDVESALTARIDHVETSLTARIEHVETSLTAKMDEQKRHADVHFESVHGDIRMLAEHLVSLTVKVDSLLR